jgi:hypothetical protein
VGETGWGVEAMVRQPTDAPASLARHYQRIRVARSFAFQKLCGSSFFGFLQQPLAQDATRPKTVARTEEKLQTPTPAVCAACTCCGGARPSRFC